MNRLILLFLLVIFLPVTPETLTSPIIYAEEKNHASIRSQEVAPDRIIHHIHAELVPEKSFLECTDNIKLPHPEARVMFRINNSIEILGVAPFAKIETSIVDNIKIVTLIFSSLQDSISIRYKGVINEPVRTIGGQARGFSYTGGTISENGVFLHGGSYWYPVFEDYLINFRLSVKLPQGWYAISQGIEEGDGNTIVWNSQEPQEEIYLVANRFIRYEEELDGLKVMVLLRDPDEELARRYISSTFKYIKMYEELIGPYPYKKFALVENFFESGFGMPSFTLLGPKVLRLPFIIDSSYPHEILHNWWGNSVWPSPEKGNWTEGLTAYLSDHLLKELKQEDREYRFTVLQKYADYVLNEKDFSLEEFRARHSAASEAIGYGKSLFLFHMFRKKFGDELFIKGLREFYQINRFKYATFNDLKESFEKVSGQDLTGFFSQWVKRKGAPELRIKGHSLKKHKNSWALSMTIRQIQKDKPYVINIPVRIYLEDGTIYEEDLKLSEMQRTFKFNLSSRPVKVDIDPELDIFRRLSREEIPPAITSVLGSRTLIVIKPSSERGFNEAYESLISVLRNAGPEEIRILEDKDIQNLPDETTVILGWDNKLLKKVPEFKDHITLEGRTIIRERDSIVVVLHHPANKEKTIMFIASKEPETIKQLARKIPHYHKYSYLVFEGKEAINTLKGRWQVKDSPMSVEFDKVANLSKRKTRKPLISIPSKDSMLETIGYLSSPELKGRKSDTPEARKAVEFIKNSFIQAKLRPVFSDQYIQIWKEQEKTFINVAGSLEGKSDGCIILGAHYDHLGMDDHGDIYPGADDNASGVSVLLEVAKFISEKRYTNNNDLIFVAFTGEESGRIGSRYFVKTLPELKRCIAMINLDTVGRLNNRRLIVIGSHSAKEWPLILREASLISNVKYEITIEDLGSSDQKSFEEVGIPAIQLFSGPHEDYHRTTDTLEKIDPEGLQKVASFTMALIERLDRTTGLSFTGNTTLREIKPSRKVSLGTIPDFAYKGIGYRISGVVKGSRADLAGIKEGDIIVEIDSKPIKGLRDFSEYINTTRPGQKLRIKIKREDDQIVFEIPVRTR